VFKKNQTLFYRGQSKLSDDDAISPSMPPDTWKNFIGASALSSSNEPEQKKIFKKLTQEQQLLTSGYPLLRLASNRLSCKCYYEGTYVNIVIFSSKN